MLAACSAIGELGTTYLLSLHGYFLITGLIGQLSSVYIFINTTNPCHKLHTDACQQVLSIEKNLGRKVAKRMVIESWHIWYYCDPLSGFTFSASLPRTPGQACQP
jgi:hypothetical protein